MASSGLSHITGWPAFLATPLFPYVPEWRKNNRVLNWPPSEMTRVQNLPPPKIGRVKNLEFRGGKFWTLPFFEGGKFCTRLLYSFKGVASSGLCCFSPFWHIGKLGGGKNSGTPCSKKKIKKNTTVQHHNTTRETLNYWLNIGLHPNKRCNSNYNRQKQGQDAFNS